MLFSRKTEPVSWIVAFLGNPGERFARTRHNAGFQTADFVEKKFGVRIDRLKFNSLTTTAVIGGKKVLLIKPQTYMNLSGDALHKAMRSCRVPLSNALVVSDDVSLPAGKLRVRRRGSSGGHNGLKDIIAKCGGEDFPRIKIGVGAPPKEGYALIDWVLSKPEGEDEKLIASAAEKAADEIEKIITNSK